MENKGTTKKIDRNRTAPKAAPKLASVPPTPKELSLEDLQAMMRARLSGLEPDARKAAIKALRAVERKQEEPLADLPENVYPDPGKSRILHVIIDASGAVLASFEGIGRKGPYGSAKRKLRAFLATPEGAPILAMLSAGEASIQIRASVR